MKTVRRGTLMAAALLCALAVTTFAYGSKKEDEQDDIRKMSQDTLQRLYAAQPKAQPIVEHAAGYAVFSNLGVKILVAGSGNGKGLAVNNKTRHETFMKMIEIQGGLGMGVKKFRVVFVFDNAKALNSFVDSGWQFGGQTTAAAKAGGKGAAAAGAIAVADGVWMYQLTDAGLALELTAKGTKYYKNDSLN